MTGNLCSFVLLGTVDRWKAVGSGLRGSGAKLDPVDLWIAGAVLFGVVLLIWVLSKFVRKERGQVFNSPRRLFHSLCKAHGLNWSSRMLLRRLARRQKLTQPARLFLEPDRFQARNLGPKLKAQQARLDRLRDTIFGEMGKIGRGRSKRGASGV
jgi:hypothetical protein